MYPSKIYYTSINADVIFSLEGDNSSDLISDDYRFDFGVDFNLFENAKFYWFWFFIDSRFIVTGVKNLY